jgi:hypothetical protein
MESRDVTLCADRQSAWGILQQGVGRDTCCVQCQHSACKKMFKVVNNNTTYKVNRRRDVCWRTPNHPPPLNRHSPAGVLPGCQVPAAVPPPPQWQWQYTSLRRLYRSPYRPRSRRGPQGALQRARGGCRPALGAAAAAACSCTACPLLLTPLIRPSPGQQQQQPQSAGGGGRRVC